MRASTSILRQVKGSIEEAAISLGAPPGRAFLKVTLPLMLPGIVAGALLSFITAINELSSTLVLYVGRTMTMPVRIYLSVLDGDFGWDDVGTWAALRRVRETDDAGNAAAGEVYAVASSGNVVHAEGGAIVLYGVSDLVVVAREGLTLVTTVDRAADLKTLLDALPERVREVP